MSFSLEQQLFHKLHSKKINSPSLKEFNESWAFCNSVRSYLKRTDIDVVIDVAGGHGCLGALFLILTSARRAVVVDPAEVGQNGVHRALNEFYKGKDLVYRYECLRTGLRDELDLILNDMKISPSRVLVVACHACQHLSDETLEISCEYGVHAAVMPCCQKDLSSSWKAVAKKLGINFASFMDILMAGKVMAWNTGIESGVQYQVRMKVIDEKITPQNRIILCKALNRDEEDAKIKIAKLKAHKKLEIAYNRAHSNPKSAISKKFFGFIPKGSFCTKSAMLGLVSGILLTTLSFSRQRK